VAPGPTAGYDAQKRARDDREQRWIDDIPRRQVLPDRVGANWRLDQ